MIFHEVEQRGLPWFKLHIGKVTASGLSNLVDTKFELRHGDMPKTYVYKKAAEAWRGEPLLDFGGSWSTEQGEILEDEAIGFAQLEYGYRVDKLGFCETEDHRAGCSPDGLIGEHSGIEMKCPAPHTHVRYLCDGTLPKDYAAQVHGSMFVTGRQEWVFFSYARGFPPLHLVVKRDEAIIAKVREAVESFAEAFDAAMARLRTIGAPE